MGARSIAGHPFENVILVVQVPALGVRIRERERCQSMRVIISAGWLGGSGGAERALYSMVRALDQDDVTVVVRERLAGPWSAVPANTRVLENSSLLWYGAGHGVGLKGRLLQELVNPLRRLIGGEYDVYIQTMAGVNLGSAVRARLRLLIPSGNPVPATKASKFTAIAMQAPDNLRFVPPGAAATLLPPPVFDIAQSARRPKVILPLDFILTVFNPYDPVKGLADLRRAVEDAPLPIVWCHSQATIKFEIPSDLANHPRITHVPDASPTELRWLYERCAAYLSVSLTEGFGWSMADALRYSPVVVSRPIGVFSNEAARQPGVALVGSPTEIDWSSALSSASAPAGRDLSVLEPGRFRASLREARRELGG